MTAKTKAAQRSTILLAARGARDSALFAQIAKNLMNELNVVATVGSYALPSKEGLESWQSLKDNLHLYHLPSEIQSEVDSVKSKGEIPLALIQDIESKLGLTLYQSASNYLTYRRFSKAYYHFWNGAYDTEKSIREEFVGGYLLAEKLFSLHAPDIIFLETPDLVSHRVLAAYAKTKGVFTLSNCFLPPLGEGQAFFACGTNRRSVLLDHLLENPELITEKSQKTAKDLLNQFKKNNPTKVAHIESYRKGSKKSLFLQSVKITTNLKRRIKPATLKKIISRRKNLKWLETNLQSTLPKEPYILFPLHHQPEAATSMVSPRWVDQDRIVELLAIHAPAGWKIVVKENPKTYGYRGSAYFSSLKKLPNVHLLSPSFSNSEAMLKAKVILGISGTAGFEGILMRKPVAVLSRCYYSAYARVWNIASPEEIFKKLKEPPVSEDKQEKELFLFTSAMIQACHYVGKGMPGTPWPAPEVGGPLYAKALAEFLKLIKKWNLKPKHFEISV